MSKSGVILGCSLLIPGLGADCMAQSAGATEGDIVETGVLQNIVGYKGDVLGAEVISIVTDEANQLEVIELIVPIDPDLADRIDVVSPSGQPIEIEDPLEVSRDTGNNEVGITLKLSKKSRLGFKIKLIDVPDD